jgi:NAD-dependent DNA ligase
MSACRNDLWTLPMPSEKLTRILHARSPFTADQIDAMTDAEGWNWVYANASPHRERLPSVCFTGFTAVEKEQLAALAKDARLSVVESVNKSLLLLCAGDSPGPAKLAKAKQHGIPIANRAAFINFLETGEIPTA